MKDIKKLRQEFIQKFGFADFEREDIEEFIEPYLNLDPEKTYRQALAREAQKLIASVRDGQNVRDCMGYELNGQRRFAWPLRTTDQQVLQAMEKRLIKQRQGIDRTITKVQARLFILRNQYTIFDFTEPQERITEFMGMPLQ